MMWMASSPAWADTNTAPENVSTDTCTCIVIIFFSSYSMFIPQKQLQTMQQLLEMQFELIRKYHPEDEVKYSSEWNTDNWNKILDM